MINPTTLERLQHWKAHQFDRVGLEYTAELIHNAAIDLDKAEAQLEGLRATRTHLQKDVKELQAQLAEYETNTEKLLDVLDGITGVLDTEECSEEYEQFDYSPCAKDTPCLFCKLQAAMRERAEKAEAQLAII